VIAETEIGVEVVTTDSDRNGGGGNDGNGAGGNGSDGNGGDSVE
jgi:hypothetical protein